MLHKPTDIAALASQARPEVVSAIRQASAQTGVDFSYLLQKAAAESSFDTDAQARTSSARGLYQFVDRTWLDTLDRHGAEHGFEGVAELITRDERGNPVVANPETKRQILALRDNPRISALMAAELAQENQAHLEDALGRKVGSTELYLAHFLGAGGAAKFLQCLDNDPGCKAAQVMPAAAQANKGVFYSQGRSLTVDEIYARFADRFGTEEQALHPLEPLQQAPVQLAGAASVEAPAAKIAAAEPSVAAPVTVVPPHLRPFAGTSLPTAIRLEDMPAFALMMEALALPVERDAAGRSWEWLA